MILYARDIRIRDQEIDKLKKLSFTMRTERYSDISTRLCAFFMKIVGLWTAENKREKLVRDLTLIYTFVTHVLATTILYRDLYFSWSDYNMALYVVSNCLSLNIVTVKLFTLTARRREFLELLAYMQKHFWHEKYDNHEKQILAATKKKCILFTSIVAMFAHATILCYVITPIIENTGKNESERILPFNLWLDNLPLSISPYYEITFFIEIMLLYYNGICYFCFDNFLCILCQHVCGQFCILQYRFTKLYEADKETKNRNKIINSANFTMKSYTELKKCIQQHQLLLYYCNKMKNLFPQVVLGQVIIFSALICLYGYQAFLARSTATRRFNFIFIMSEGSYLLFMFTYSCHRLIVESENIADAAYLAPWTIMPMDKYGRRFRSDLHLTILRSKRACCLTACGFFPVNMKTFTTVMSTAVSYFTLLKQRLENTLEA